MKCSCLELLLTRLWQKNPDSQQLLSAFDLCEPAGILVLEERLNFNLRAFVWEQAEPIMWSQSENLLPNVMNVHKDNMLACICICIVNSQFDSIYGQQNSQTTQIPVKFLCYGTPSDPTSTYLWVFVLLRSPICDLNCMLQAIWGVHAVLVAFLLRRFLLCCPLGSSWCQMGCLSASAPLASWWRDGANVCCVMVASILRQFVLLSISV